jgi:chemotaxis protein CheX
MMASKKGDQKGLKLAAVLDLNEASNLKANILAMRGAPLTIDASGVERLGAQCVQVLLAAAKAWEVDKQPFSFGKASEAFLKTLQLIGVNIDHLLAKEIRQ